MLMSGFNFTAKKGAGKLYFEALLLVQGIERGGCLLQPDTQKVNMATQPIIIAISIASIYFLFDFMRSISFINANIGQNSA